MAGAIYTAISGVMKDVGAVGKDKYNEMQRYKFRGIDDVMNALHPAMAAHRVFVAPEVLESSREERRSKKYDRQGNERESLLIYSIVKVRYRFYTDDGSSVEAVVIGEAMDSGDKSMNKAMSAAFKYACFQTFCIPTEEMKDSETDSPEPEPKTDKKERSEPAGTAYPTREEMMRRVLMSYPPESGNYRALVAAFGVPSLADASDAQIMAVYSKCMEKATA